MLVATLFLSCGRCFSSSWLLLCVFAKVEGKESKVVALYQKKALAEQNHLSLVFRQLVTKQPNE